MHFFDIDGYVIEFFDTVHVSHRFVCLFVCVINILYVWNSGYYIFALIKSSK